MNTDKDVQYRRWCPPESPLQIEYSTGLLRELQPDQVATEHSGALYGLRQGLEIRSLTTQPEPAEDLEHVGIFVTRLRGEVFLTESDLAMFEDSGGAVALVVAGNQGGFFVRESNGSIQTVRSHEEFSLYEELPLSEQPAGAVAGRAPRRWTWAMAAFAGLAIAGLPVAAVISLRPGPFPRALPPAKLLVSEERGLIRISWTPGQMGVLEIRDAGEHITVPVLPSQSNATHARRSAEVEIGLITWSRDAAPQRVSAQSVGVPSVQAPDPSIVEVGVEIERLRTEAETLRAELAGHRAVVAALQKAINGLTRANP